MTDPAGLRSSAWDSNETFDPESLRRHRADLDTDVLQHLDTMNTILVPVPRGRNLKGHRGDVSDIQDFCRVLRISRESVYRELIRYSRLNLLTERRLP